MIGDGVRLSDHGWSSGAGDRPGWELCRQTAPPRCGVAGWECL